MPLRDRLHNPMMSRSPRGLWLFLATVVIILVATLEVGNEFRARGIPVNVIGVGKDRPRGDLRISL